MFNILVSIIIDIHVQHHVGSLTDYFSVDMGRRRNIHSKEHLKRLRKSHAERPAGFYRKGGKTRPITKPKAKKTRVVKVNAGAAWRAWIIDHIKKAGEDPDLVTIQPDPHLIAIYPKWSSRDARWINKELMRRFNPIMEGVGARWNEGDARWIMIWDLRKETFPFEGRDS